MIYARAYILALEETLCIKCSAKKPPCRITTGKAPILSPVKDDKIAVVKTPKGLFPLGGGLETGETDEACIRRECLEEAGVTVTVGEKIGSAETFTTHPRLGPFHPIQTYYAGEILKQVQAPLEKDHTLLICSFRELDGKLFAEMQNWALREFWKKHLQNK